MWASLIFILSYGNGIKSPTGSSFVILFRSPQRWHTLHFALDATFSIFEMRFFAFFPENINKQYEAI